MTIAEATQWPTGAAGVSHVSMWEASELLGLRPYEVYELCTAGLISHTTWGDVIRVDMESLREYAPRLGRTIP